MKRAPMPEVIDILRRWYHSLSRHTKDEVLEKQCRAAGALLHQSENLDAEQEGEPTDEMVVET